MVRYIKAEEQDHILAWHFRNVDSAPGGRESYARAFPAEYRHVIETLNGEAGFVLVAEEGGSIAGYIGVRIDEAPSPSRAYLCGFYVEPKKRREGYGRALAEQAVALTKESGAGSLSVEVGLQKPWLIAFYKSVGFVQSSVNMYQELEG